MKAEILSIGTELLLGEITDTNAVYLASQLPQLGVDLLWITQVGDNRYRITEILAHAWNRSDLILITGGLGPTEDDLTREAIAGLLGEEMSVDPELESWLRDLFRRAGHRMPENNLKQAMLIPSAKPIPNTRGTAPGWWISREGKTMLAMPGPPGEIRQMWEDQIREQLRLCLDTAVIASRTLKLLEIGEADVDRRLSAFLSSPNPSIGVYAKRTGIELRLTAKAETRPQAEEMIAPLEEEIRTVIGDKIWGCDDNTLEAVIGDLLRDKGKTVSVMESCTGGLLASLITDVPGSSDYFNGGLVAYSNEAKTEFGVDAGLIAEYGAVSPECAEAMAQAARTQLKSDIGIGTTGVAGPEELEGKPVGTVFIGISDGTTTQSVHTGFPQHRRRLKQYAAMDALNQLRKFLS